MFYLRRRRFVGACARGGHLFLSRLSLSWLVQPFLAPNSRGCATMAVWEKFYAVSTQRSSFHGEFKAADQNLLVF